MKRGFHFIWIAGLALLMAACSSSKPASDDGSSGDQVPAADAGTDAVPQPTTELPATGGEAAAGDPAAAPASGDAVAAAPADAPPAPADSTPPATDTASSTTPAATETAASTTPSEPIGTGQFDSYTVQDGDTLMKIAFETYGDLYKWKNILDANKDTITDPNKLPKGATIKLEKPANAVTIERNGEKYLIVLGDTLGKISNKVYGTQGRWKSIWENNKQLIHDPNKIFAGFTLYYQKDDGATSSTRAPSSNQ